ncbi:serine/arginine-rich splicing factor RS2Z33-like [Fopius arisanus]|uniref:Serine/arginine-rich splicing factor RS2Z33-like n=1 Tax=Fopius arisanus TaxID=64838 RepID=A0A9R1TQP2_9HYME|nr:PREDICTED: serine/arginine-rich splicing factor RS2Z33-like [Fopius arisanus]
MISRRKDDQSTGTRPPSPQCFNCGVPSHRRQQCPKPAIVVCFRCGRKGNTTRTCPQCGDQWRAEGPYIPALGRNVPRDQLTAQQPKPPAEEGRKKKGRRAPRAQRPLDTRARAGPPPSPPERHWDYQTTTH